MVATIECWIDAMVTSERMRRQGIATSLLIAASATAPGEALLSLNVSSRNEPAIHLYKALGFSEFRRQRRLVLFGKV
ncbi:GNAT family N-acetyltransferase [Bradyrhizobium sp. STM 3809]|uniref:GNAT family N-acetyltransferase n=1 Tax=Bradyrhizobium sp. STM 3809 TaxID=551936 RepID=UPI0002405FC2|nr:GNAT family N-acetyltransferase [Bradyrhizobium sp. STM 3809]CCD97591.1 putative enzyme [Bradyrhizobium sp. STM 3809]